jgi:hypothetical protein
VTISINVRRSRCQSIGAFMMIWTRTTPRSADQITSARP